MANNKVKQIWASGKAVVNAWLAIPSGFSAEVIAQCGFDSVTVDMQHVVQDYQSMVQCFQAMHAHPVTPMVRVPWNDHVRIKQVLDLGVEGIMAPMVNSVAECKAFVAACKYPPAGRQGDAVSILPSYPPRSVKREDSPGGIGAACGQGFDFGVGDIVSTQQRIGESFPQADLQLALLGSG